MKIFLLKLNLESKENIKSNFYYSVLGSVLNLFENDEKIYNSILSISPLIKKSGGEFLIKFSILGEKNFNIIINKILENKKILSLDGIKFNVLGVDFSFGIFDFKNIEYKKFENILLEFKSPCFVKKKNKNLEINFFLPEAKIFFSSAIRKYIDITGEKISRDFIEKLKQKIEQNFFIVEFNIHTKKVKLKTGIKAGVVGNIKYKLNKNNNFEKEELILINNALKLANYIGIGNSTKLGLGQVMVKIF